MGKVMFMFLAVLLISAGCYQTKIARPQVSQEESAWEDIIRQSYPGYKAPPKSSRSVKGHTEERFSAVVRSSQVKAQPDPAAPAPMEIPADEPAPEEIPAEVPAEKPADTPAVTEVKPAEAPAAAEVKPEEKPAEVPAEKPADAPAEKPAVKAETPVAAAMPPDPTNSTVYVVKSGDTLGAIAQKNYGQASYSNVIFKANSDILKSPDKLRPGMKLIIPKL